MQFLTNLLAATAICAGLLTFGAFTAAVTPDTHRREGLKAETILSKGAPPVVTGDRLQLPARAAMRQFATDSQSD